MSEGERPTVTQKQNETDCYIHGDRHELLIRLGGGDDGIKVRLGAWRQRRLRLRFNR